MKKKTTIALVGLCVLNMIVWSAIAFDDFGKRFELYFLAVGQGDSEMVVLPGNVKLLIDGGPPNGKAAQQIDTIMPWHDRYIDLVMISHAELDHFGGLLDVLQRYEVGALVYNGHGSDSESFKELANLVKRKRIPVVVIGERDTITHASSVFEVLSSEGKNQNEGALVVKVTGGGASALFTGDIGRDTEMQLMREKNIRADILKIPHHGSKFSSTKEFLAAVQPKITVIEVGKNSYGHPTSDVLQRIETAGAQLFRTDTDGLVKLVVEDGRVVQYAENGGH